MKLEIVGHVGPALLNDSCETALFRQGRSGETVVQNLHGRYTEIVLREKVFSAAHTAAQAVSAALATAYTGFLLYNPIGSGVILNPLFVKPALNAAPAELQLLARLFRHAITFFLKPPGKQPFISPAQPL